ncbi:TSUP family transporter [Marinomonas sp.]|uniref:TSUP family transporter n=1 Tax=Marinomonas sp. TaxID=1904862 RepID=UPI003BA9826A
MPSIEMFFLLLFIGAATGSVASVTKIAPALIAIPALYFFLPVFNLSFQSLMLPVIATCIIAFIPAHLHAWITSMKKGEVDSQQLINFAPGVAMGGVIGAQLLSLSSLLIFKMAFSLIALISVVNIVFRPQLDKMQAVQIGKSWCLPIGLIVGVLSLLSGNDGRVLGNLLCTLKKIEKTQHQGTSDGFVVFASIAAMIGFIYPAQTFDHLGLSGFAGAVHLPFMIILSCSHWFFYWLCRSKGNELDKNVLSISFVVFIVCSLIRLWIS